MQQLARVFSAGAWSEPLPRDLDSRRTMVLVFGAPEYALDDAPFADLRAAFPRSHIVGCSTAGEIMGPSILDRSVVVIVARFERTEVRTAREPVARHTSFEAGVRLARTVAGPDLRGCLLLTSGHDVNGGHLTKGLESVLGKVPISGGLAADGRRFGKTWLIDDGRPREGIACLVGFYGDAIRLGHGTKAGWDKFGPERVITRAEGNVVYELDGRPALDLYKAYLGEMAAALPGSAVYHPLAVRSARGDREPCIRGVMGHCEQSRSLTFVDDMPEGALAQLMRANFDRVVDAAGQAAAAAMIDGASLSIAVSCVARRMVLGEREEEETEAISGAMPGSLVAGFYSNGEIAPDALGGCSVHNQTMTITAFSET
jgi:hypothetical protein